MYAIRSVVEDILKRKSIRVLSVKASLRITDRSHLSLSAHVFGWNASNEARGVDIKPKSRKSWGKSGANSEFGSMNENYGKKPPKYDTKSETRPHIVKGSTNRWAEKIPSKIVNKNLVKPMYNVRSPEIHKRGTTPFHPPPPHHNRKDARFDETEEYMASDFDVDEPKASRKHKIDETEWADSFGTLSGKFDQDFEHVSEALQRTETFEDDGDDVAPLVTYQPGLRDRHPSFYTKQIKRLGATGKIYEALQVVEERMLKKDRVKPDAILFENIVKICGEVGYVTKAFEMHNKMKEFGIEPTNFVYTSLFKACALSEDKTLGLKKAQELRRTLTRIEFKPTFITQRAIIMAFARCGDVEGAFEEADAYIEAGHYAQPKLYSMLLQACLSDKDSGLKLAVELMRKVRKRGLADSFIYNLFVKTIRDCNFGIDIYAQNLIKGAAAKKLQEMNGEHIEETALATSATEQKMLPELTPVAHNDMVDQDSVVENQLQVIDRNKPKYPPNLLNMKGRLLEVISFKNTCEPYERLALFGGFRGILSHMKIDRIVPNLKTFTILLQTLPPSGEAENDLMQAMADNTILPDVCFFNLLILRRNKREEFEAAKSALGMMVSRNIEPNGMTFGCLATACHQQEEGIALLKEITAMGFAPSIRVYEQLVRNAQLNFSYLKEILEHMTLTGIQVSVGMVVVIERKLVEARKELLREEKERIPTTVKYEDYEAFRRYYDKWSRKAEVAESEESTAKFQRPTPELYVDDYAGSVFRQNQAIQTKPFRLQWHREINDPYVKSLFKYYITNSHIVRMVPYEERGFRPKTQFQKTFGGAKSIPFRISHGPSQLRLRGGQRKYPK